MPPPVGVRDDLEIIFDLARRLGHDWASPDAELLWDELRLLSPMHAGMITADWRWAGFHGREL